MSEPTGRPYIASYDSLSKSCEQCGSLFFLRDKKFKSFSRFMRRRFCSVECCNFARSANFSNRKAWVLERIEVDDQGCWNWKRRLTAKGYGEASFGRKKVRSHRYAFEVWRGPISDGLMVLHSCDNRACCNPDHLRTGTALDNARDAVARNRLPKTRRKKAQSAPNKARPVAAQSA